MGEGRQGGVGKGNRVHYNNKMESPRASHPPTPLKRNPIHYRRKKTEQMQRSMDFKTAQTQPKPIPHFT